MDKAGDFFIGGSGRGVSIFDSYIQDCDYSLMNTSQFLNIRFNVMEGEVVSEGLCYSQWISNNITANHITLQSPIQSSRLENNLFNTVELELYLSNDLTYSLCDTWKNIETNGYAFSGGLSATLPTSWGGFEGNNVRSISSGNRHLDESEPHFKAYDNLQNYYFYDNEPESFTYDISPSIVTGVHAFYERSCSYNYPIVIREYNPNYSDDIINYTNENNIWTSLNTIKSQKESSLANATLSEIPILLEEINYTTFKMSDIVGNVISNLTSADSSILNTWISRSNPLLLRISELAKLWYENDFAGIANTISISEGDDAQTLLEAANYAKIISITNRSVDSLSMMELDTLTQIASLTFGDYSNVVRDFLRVVYNIDIPWPVDRNILNTRSSELVHHLKEKLSTNSFSLTPNPTTGCFSMVPEIAIEGKLYMQIFDLQGRELKSSFIDIGIEFCLEGLGDGIYIIALFEPKTNNYQFKKLFLKNN